MNALISFMSRRDSFESRDRCEPYASNRLTPTLQTVVNIWSIGGTVFSCLKMVMRKKKIAILNERGLSS